MLQKFQQVRFLLKLQVTASAITAPAPSKAVTGANNTVYADTVSEVKASQKT